VAKYFTIMHGLRGCYMPDSEPCVLMARTRRELKSAIISESGMIDSGSTQGFGKRAVATFAAILWREAHKPRPAFLPFALPYKETRESDCHNAIFVSVADRAEYLESIMESENA